MNLSRNGVTIQVDETAIMEMIAQRLSDDIGRRPMINSLCAPRIGAVWSGQGGNYAGIMRGRDGEPDYHLIVGNPIIATTWQQSKAFAEEMEIDGHKDFVLPFRAEQALQFANVPELFEEEWYWSCEQPAAHADYAWYQDFGNGYQSYTRKSLKLRARTVRRLVIQ
jgi:hypothetical protein